jgi:hypothetical protein
MNNLLKNVAKTASMITLAALGMANCVVNASVITIETGYSTAGAQATGAAYKSVVDAAVATATKGYGTASLAQFDKVTNKALFGASANIATEYTVDFYVSAAKAGVFNFRVGPDFGFGGAVFLDNTQVALITKDMWWSNSYANNTQSFLFASNLAEGQHILEVYGLENCCDGSAQGQFKGPQATSFTTFGKTDGLTRAVPEPASIALLGLGFLGLAVSRKKRA